MADNDCLQKNLDLLAQTQPQLTLRLELRDKPDRSLLAAHKIPQTELEAWFNAIPLDEVEVLYVYGMGDGGAFLCAKEWLEHNQQRYLVFLEEAVEVLHAFLTTPLATELLEHPQVQIHSLSPNNRKETIESLSWYFFECPLYVAALPHYAKKNKERWQQIDHEVQYDAALKHALIDEYIHYGIAFFRNFYPNLYFLEGAFHGNGLFGKAEGIPAIICGAGPSLNKNGHLLRQSLDKALLFAGGSSLNALQKMGIRPHFGAGIDPNREQEKRLRETQKVVIPFFYRNRIYNEALRCVKGPRLYINGSGGYDIADWVEEKFAIAGEAIEEGHNVVHFCAEIARAMGCNPIIFVGVDLAFTEGQAYAEGIQGIPSSRMSLDERPITQKDLSGKTVDTLWKWIAEREWLSDFAKTHPEISMINATEGGLGFPPVPNQTLEEVLTNLPKNPSIERLFAEELPQHRLSITSAQVTDLLTRLRDSLLRCEHLCGKILEEVAVIQQKIAEGKFSPSDLLTGASALYETELAEEPAYPALLDIFAAVLTRLLQREIRQIQAQAHQLTPAEMQKRKLETSAKRFVFLQDTARLHAELIQKILRKYAG